MSNSTLKRNDDSTREKTPKKSKPARVFAILPGSGTTMLAFVPYVVSIKFFGTALLVRVFLCSRCPAARFFVFSFFRFFAFLCLCPRSVSVMFYMCVVWLKVFLKCDWSCFHSVFSFLSAFSVLLFALSVRSGKTHLTLCITNLSIINLARGLVRCHPDSSFLRFKIFFSSLSPTIAILRASALPLALLVPFFELLQRQPQKRRQTNADTRKTDFAVFVVLLSIPACPAIAVCFPLLFCLLASKRNTPESQKTVWKQRTRPDKPPLEFDLNQGFAGQLNDASVTPGPPPDSSLQRIFDLGPKHTRDFYSWLLKTPLERS